MKFNLKEQAWTLVDSKGIIPKARSAHAAVANDLQTIIFFHGGGCKDGTILE